ncbi:MAG: hypothetical protein DRN15_00060 [Thermoprotei archaeon]|nr:MAG: hypothetical protein DRM97_05980 [Thermoprotei archaeon]RLF25089.1 MAG: hypothetical protein DRN15_00060 [Thermoprotei archaeon]
MSGEDKPLVSIVVPTRNCEKTIELLLKSLSKVKGNFEVIIVDASTDRTPEIVRRYPFAKLIKVEHKGINWSRNIGVKVSRGDIVAFTDGDCIVPENWIERILKAFNRGKYACVGGNVYVAPQLRGNIIAEYADNALIPLHPIYDREKVISVDNFYSEFHLRRCPPGNNMAFRKEVLLKIGLFDERFWIGYDDVDIMWRLCLNGYRIYCDPAIVVYHLHRSRLLDLLKQAYRYGKGHYVFYSKHKNSPFSKITHIMLSGSLGFLCLMITLGAMTLAGLLNKIILPIFLLSVYLVHALLYRVWRKVSVVKCLLYPIIDFMVYSSYVIGFLKQMVCCKIGKGRL